jgi:hypothetical protein
MDRTAPIPASRSNRAPTPGDTPRSLPAGTGSEAPSHQWFDDALNIWLRGDEDTPRARSTVDATPTPR